MQHENRTIAAPKAISRRLKVSLQNPCLADLPIGKKTIGSLRVGPILACPWNALSYSAQSCSNSFRNLLFNRTSLNSHPANSSSIHPLRRHFRCFRIAELRPLLLHPVSSRLEAESISATVANFHPELWVIERDDGTLTMDWCSFRASCFWRPSRQPLDQCFWCKQSSDWSRRAALTLCTSIRLPRRNTLLRPWVEGWQSLITTMMGCPICSLSIAVSWSTTWKRRRSSLATSLNTGIGCTGRTTMEALPTSPKLPGFPGLAMETTAWNWR